MAFVGLIIVMVAILFMVSHCDSISLFRSSFLVLISLFFFNDTATTEIYTLSLHDALRSRRGPGCRPPLPAHSLEHVRLRSEEHTSELQSPDHLVCRLLLEKKKTSID